MKEEKTKDKDRIEKVRDTNDPKKPIAKLTKVLYGWVKVSMLIVSVLPLWAFAAGQQPRQQQQQPRQYQPPSQPWSDVVGPTVIVSPDENYRIGPSDVLSIEVADAPEISRAIRVNAEGQIVMPVIGTILALKKTPDELAQFIANALRSQQYLQDPQVNVSVLQINSRTFFIQGAVRRPGVYQIEGKPSLFKLVSVAGGLSENYGSTAYVIREIKSPVTGDKGQAPGDRGRGTANAVLTPALARTTNQEPQTTNPEPGTTNPEPDSSRPRRASAEVPQAITSGSSNSSASDDDSEPARYELLKVNITGLLRGNFDENIAMRPGDIVHIPPTDVFFVAGEVKSPGSFPLKEGTTLRQAISLAQGPTFNAASNRGVIFREDASTGKRSEIKVDISAVMAGKKEDVAILANDIIIVPNSRLKTVGGTLLRAFGVNATRIPVY